MTAPRNDSLLSCDDGAVNEEATPESEEREYAIAFRSESLPNIGGMRSSAIECLRSFLLAFADARSCAVWVVSEYFWDERSSSCDSCDDVDKRLRSVDDLDVSSSSARRVNCARPLMIESTSMNWSTFMTMGTIIMVKTTIHMHTHQLWDWTYDMSTHLEHSCRHQASQVTSLPMQK